MAAAPVMDPTKFRVCPANSIITGFAGVASAGRRAVTSLVAVPLPPEVEHPLKIAVKAAIINAAKIALSFLIVYLLCSFLIAHFSFLCYIINMTITQTVEIPADRRITLEVPREVPTGPVVLTFTPARYSVNPPEKSEARDIELFDRYADELNAEAEDVLSYQNMYLDEIEK